MRADFSDAPPCGTACGFCRAEGHFCPAKGWLGEMPTCRPCGEGKPCPQALAVIRMRTPPDASGLAAVAPIQYERRCRDCKGKLSDLIVGDLCSRCRKRAKEIADRSAAAAERAAALAIGKGV